MVDEGDENTHTDRYIYICVCVDIWDHRMGVFHTREIGLSGNFHGHAV